MFFFTTLAISVLANANPERSLRIVGEAHRPIRHRTSKLFGSSTVQATAPVHTLPVTADVSVHSQNLHLRGSSTDNATVIHTLYAPATVHATPVPADGTNGSSDVDYLTHATDNASSAHGEQGYVDVDAPVSVQVTVHRTVSVTSKVDVHDAQGLLTPSTEPDPAPSSTPPIIISKSRSKLKTEPAAKTVLPRGAVPPKKTKTSFVKTSKLASALK